MALLLTDKDWGWYNKLCNLFEKGTPDADMQIAWAKFNDNVYANYPVKESKYFTIKRDTGEIVIDPKRVRNVVTPKISKSDKKSDEK